jgi:hypothetical protein
MHITRWEVNQRSIRDSGFQPLHKLLILKMVSAIVVETLENSSTFYAAHSRNKKPDIKLSRVN